MKDISTKLDGMVAKINVILDDYIQMEKEYLQLTLERNGLKALADEQRQQINELKSRLHKLQSMNERTLFDGSPSNGEMKREINELIVEIEQCINLLGN